MSYQKIADRCRWENLGYRDGKPGTPEDVALRLAEYERFTASRDASLAFLRERLVVTDEMASRLIEAFAREQAGSPEGSCPTPQEQLRRCREALRFALAKAR